MKSKITTTVTVQGADSLVQACSETLRIPPAEDALFTRGLTCSGKAASLEHWENGMQNAAETSTAHRCRSAPSIGKTLQEGLPELGCAGKTGVA